MNRVIQIKAEMNKLETRLEQLRKELSLLQIQCDHEFKSNNYRQECSKCHLIESLNW